MTTMIGLVLTDLKKALINAKNMLKSLKENKQKRAKSNVISRAKNIKIEAI